MSKAVVIGIDLGAAESYVAYVGKGIVDIVQNEVSKRATPTFVGFTDRERLSGDAALSLIRSNAKNTCRNFKHLIGRKVDAPDVEKEHFWSTAKLCECADGFAGYAVTYKGEERQMSAVECTAMYLTKLREITETWCEGKVQDIVVSVPSSFSDVQRQAVLDAASIANLKVLRLMNEHTATALAYGIYRSNDFDAEKAMTVAFCSIGQSLFSVSIVKFVRGKLTVICERSDKVGGRELDECLMREFAAQFKKKVGADPLSNKKALYKLEDAVMKCKKILSANNEAPINVECLMEDEDFASTITREDLEKMCAPAMERARAVLEGALKDSGLTVEQIDSVEMVGGGSRVPWVKTMCKDVFGKDLSTTMNQEESVARGCALQAAILSPLYKVRDFTVEDNSPFAINIGWMGAAPPPEGAKEEDGDEKMTDAEGVFKTSTVFPAGSPMNLLKSLTFYRKESFELKAEYADESLLLPMTPKELGSYRIELPPQTEAKKVKVRAKLTLNGILAIEGAQLVEEEEYEETIKEKRELPAEEDSPMEAEGEKPAEEGEKSAEGEAEKPAEEGEKKEEKKEEKKKEPKFEWVDVKRTKKRTKRTDLKITKTGTPGLSPETVQKLMDAESAMQAEMAEIIETDAKRNDLEGYILNMRHKTEKSGEYGEFISDADRETFSSELMKAEDWLYDHEDATKIMYIEKMDELRRTGDAVAWRFKESEMRPDWIKAVNGTVSNFRGAAQNDTEKFGHIAAEKLQSIVTACNELEAWLKDMVSKQEALPKHEKPVLICAEMEKRNQDLAKMADDILKEPKPAPPKEEPKAEEPSPAQAAGEADKPADAAAEPPADKEAKAEEEPSTTGDDMEVN